MLGVAGHDHQDGAQVAQQRHQHLRRACGAAYMQGVMERACSAHMVCTQCACDAHAESKQKVAGRVARTSSRFSDSALRGPSSSCPAGPSTSGTRVTTALTNPSICGSSWLHSEACTRGAGAG